MDHTEPKTAPTAEQNAPAKCPEPKGTPPSEKPSVASIYSGAAGLSLDLYGSARAATRQMEVDWSAITIICRNPLIARNIADYRSGNAAAKKKLPAITFMGKSRSGRRRAEEMDPTGLFMIDVDHATRDPHELFTTPAYAANADRIVFAHITPSGKGLRLVATMYDDVLAGLSTGDLTFQQAVIQCVERMTDDLGLRDYGDIDMACKDISRMSFLPQAEDIIKIRADLKPLPPPSPTGEGASMLLRPLPPPSPTGEGASKLLKASLATNTSSEVHQTSVTQSAIASTQLPLQSERAGGEAFIASTQPPLQSERAGGEAVVGETSAGEAVYKSTPVRTIVKRYLEVYGTPSEGETHNFYNGMVVNFRHICNNSPETLVDVLPLFGQTRANRLSQCQSICRKNTSARIPFTFYKFLKDNGFMVEESDDGELELTTPPHLAALQTMPLLPPVMREIVEAAPDNFKIATVFSLLPVLGSLTTYAQAPYYDGEMHTTSFMSVVIAPPSSGKSFTNRFLNFSDYEDCPSNLLRNFVKRDLVTAARTDLWLNFSNIKKGDERGKIRPRTTTRIMPPIFSQADFLPVMNDNQGMHLFTFAPEIDTFIKGMKAGGGGDKSDMIRIAWDNGIYGQSFRGYNSFRGKVALYYNVLMTGTPAQNLRLFTDLENGLVTRCSFVSLDNLQFAEYQPWKPFSKKALATISDFVDKCDQRTYTTPLECDMGSLDYYTDDEEFDKAIRWQYRFRGRTTYDLSFLHEPLLDWLEEKRREAQSNVDMAMDVCRKRSAGKAFRAALVAYQCYPNVRTRERRAITEFALWVAETDLNLILSIFGERYNDSVSEQMPTVRHGSIYDALPDTFSLSDLQAALVKAGRKTPARNVIYCWASKGLVVKNGNHYEKVK